MVGVLLVGAFCAVSLAYACTEFLTVQLDLRRRITTGKSGLFAVLGVNAASLALVWISSAILVAASRHPLHLQATLISVGAQSIWLIQMLWFYRRDHLRVRYE